MRGRGFDDEIEFNTQYSSQWDSLCHVVNPESGQTYNGATPTKDLLSVTSTEDNILPTADHWHARGGIVGRGVLIDFKGYIEETTGAEFSPLDGHRITTQDVEMVAKHHGVEFKPGDILIIRTGCTESLENPTPEMFAKLQRRTLSGLHGTEETARWVWNKRFAAVAGDALAFEAYPPLKPDGSVGEAADLGTSRSLANREMSLPRKLLRAKSQQCCTNGSSSTSACPSGSFGISGILPLNAKRPAGTVSC